MEHEKCTDQSKIDHKKIYNKFEGALCDDFLLLRKHLIKIYNSLPIVATYGKRKDTYIYLAGGISGDVNFRDKFAHHERVLKENGYMGVINPVKIPQPDYHDWANCMRITLDDMLVKSNAICILPDFVSSKGATIEFFLSLVTGQKILRWDIKPLDDMV